MSGADLTATVSGKTGVAGVAGVVEHRQFEQFVFPKIVESWESKNP